jgi:hypothetical protein
MNVCSSGTTQQVQGLCVIYSLMQLVHGEKCLKDKLPSAAAQHVQHQNRRTAAAAAAKGVHNHGAAQAPTVLGAFDRSRSPHVLCRTLFALTYACHSSLLKRPALLGDIGST